MKFDKLSGYTLEKAGWEKDGRKYARGISTMEFNGVDWFLNGKKMDGDVPEEIITKRLPPIFNPQVPSDINTEQEIKDYYERMMENK